jgi:hypothetical protein
MLQEPHWHVDFRLNKACYIVRVIIPFLSLASLQVIYHAYFHSVITYGLIFCGTSTHSSNIFKLQKRIGRILMGARPRNSCRKFFITLNILPLASQYIYSLAFFMVTKISLFRLNSKIHNFNTRNLLSVFVSTEFWSLVMILSLIVRYIGEWSEFRPKPFQILI